MTSLYYGEIKPERIGNWKDNKDPFDILVDMIEITPKPFFQRCQAKGICSDEVQVDWGSFAYKCTKAQLMNLEEAASLNIKGLDSLKDDVMYGLVWIEEY